MNIPTRQDTLVPLRYSDNHFQATRSYSFQAANPHCSLQSSLVKDFYCPNFTNGTEEVKWLAPDYAKCRSLHPLSSGEQRQWLDPSSHSNHVLASSLDNGPCPPTGVSAVTSPWYLGAIATTLFDLLGRNLSSYADWTPFLRCDWFSGIFQDQELMGNQRNLQSIQITAMILFYFQHFRAMSLWLLSYIRNVCSLKLWTQT